MKATGLWILRSALLTVALVAGTVGAGIALPAPAHPAFVAPVVPDGPLSLPQALLTVSSGEALLLSLLAARSSARGWKLGISLAVVLFCVETGLSMIEASFFNVDLHLPVGAIWWSVRSGLLRDAICALAIALLWREEHAKSVAAPTGLGWKVPSIAILYVVAYSVAGYFIAWQSPAVRDFYPHAKDIAIGELALLEIGRGLVWAALAVLLFRCLRGRAWEKAALTGAAFALFGTLVLLYPSEFMPWIVRRVHFVEMLSSNFVFGVLSAILLVRGTRLPTS
jgi:hypothetical protein